MGLSIFRPSFNSSKCKTWAKMATARIKLLRNKREALVRQMRRDVALLLESGQDAAARIRVEHVIREQNMMAATELIELFCEHIVIRLQIISKQRDCPPDLKEGICSLIFAASRCSDIPELVHIKQIFQKKYGKDFVSAASDLRPDSGVSRLLIEKLSARSPGGELKMKVMKEIAKEYEVDWDTTETELELLKPSEDNVEAPSQSVVNPPSKQTLSQPVIKEEDSSTRFSVGDEMTFEDAASAAKAAAQSAKDAIAAAQAAARFANSKIEEEDHGKNTDYEKTDRQSNYSGIIFEEEDHRKNTDYEKTDRRSNYSGIKFDESDSDEDYETLPARLQGLMYQKSHL